MNYGEVIQIPASAYWRISVGDWRGVSISDASVGMIRSTAAALSKDYPSEEVIVTSDSHIRWVFKAGEEVNRLDNEEITKRCPYDSVYYRKCWAEGRSFPTEAWVDVKKDGQKSIL